MRVVSVNPEECEVVSSSGVRFSAGKTVLNHSSADASIISALFNSGNEKKKEAEIGAIEGRR